MELLAVLYMLGIVALSGYALYLVISLAMHCVKRLYKNLKRQKNQ